MTTEQPSPPRRQFSLTELFVATTVIAVWCALGRYFLGPWLLFTIMAIGPAMFFLGQRWQLYWLQLSGVLLTFVSPCLAALIVGALRAVLDTP